jgi:glycosyltransferase involved in cell wall biosynthesis
LELFINSHLWVEFEILKLKKQKHILILTSWYPSLDNPYLGNYIQQFATLLSETCDVTVVVLEKNELKAGETVLEKISESLQEIRAYYGESFLNKSKIKAHRKSLKFVKSYIPSINLIHVHIGMTNWWHFLLFKRALKKPMVYSEHGSYYFKENFNQVNLIQRAGLKRLLYSAEEVTAVSELLKLEMEKNYPKFTNVIGNILPKSWEGIPIKDTHQQEYRFLHVSTVDPSKNVTGILQAVAILKEKGINNFELTILSDESTDDLQRYVAENELTDFVKFLGPHSHSEMPQIYRNHDCFVLNSNFETFSIVLAEALFFGLHIISTKVGFLANTQRAPYEEVAKNNPDHLAIKMEKAIVEKKLSGIEGREFVKQFSQDAILERYLEIYDKLL